jgi:fumarylacetoacetase
MGIKINIPSDSPFTIRNIPFGVITTKSNTTPRCASAIGDYAVDLAIYSQRGHLSNLSLNTSIKDIFSQVVFIVHEL